LALESSTSTYSRNGFEEADAGERQEQPEQEINQPEEPNERVE